MESLWQMGMLIVGGMGTITGAIMGTVFLKLLGEFTAYLAPIVATVVPTLEAGVIAALALIVYGIVIALFILFEPRGLMHRWEVFKTSYRMWPFAR